MVGSCKALGAGSANKRLQFIGYNIFLRLIEFSWISNFIDDFFVLAADINQSIVILILINIVSYRILRKVFKSSGLSALGK